VPSSQRRRRRRCQCHDARESLESQGYDFYLQMLYLFMTALILLLAGTAWSVHASRNPRAWQWPISLLRFCVFIFFEVCYVGVINVFFVAMDCQWLSGSPAMAEHVREYPDVGACLSVRLPAWGHPLFVPCAYLPFADVLSSTSPHDSLLQLLARGPPSSDPHPGRGAADAAAHPPPMPLPLLQCA
jgi:hypothetical protein